MSANRGLSLARGWYITRQDYDDISRFQILEIPISFVDANPNIYLVGAATEIFNLQGATGIFYDHPTKSVFW